MLLKLSQGSELWCNDPVVGTLVGAFAVDGHAAGDDHFPEAITYAPGIHRGVKDGCPAKRVDVRVAPDVVHALRHADKSGLVEQDIHAFKRAGDGIGVSDIPDDEFDIAR